MELDESIAKALNISLENKMVFPKSKRAWTDDTAVVDMIQTCRDENDFTLISELFHQLNDNIVDGAKSYELLCEMANVIKRNEPEGDNTALCVMRSKNDKESDGSQQIINELKIALEMNNRFKYGYSSVCFEDIERLYKKGYRHFIVIDDFIGSGKTVNARYKYFQDRHLQGATIGFYFLAGMAKGISYCKNRNIPVHCCKIMHKGINGHFRKEELLQRIRIMRYFESLLGKESGTAELKENTFGYGYAEALYCRQFGNIPNSVFPIFWWNKKIDGSDRKTVFRRVQDGY